MAANGSWDVNTEEGVHYVKIHICTVVFDIDDSNGCEDL
jgi:hypothetical protein